VIDRSADTQVDAPAPWTARILTGVTAWFRSILRRAPKAIIVAIVILLLFGWISTPAFVSYDNVQNIVRAASITGLVAVSMTLLTVGGLFFSLSAEETASLCAITFAAALNAGFDLPLAIVATLLVALVVGVGQGGLIALGGNPIVTTLGAAATLVGFTSVITGNTTVRPNTHVADFIGQSRPLGIPTQTFAFIGVVILASVVLSRTVFGRRLTLLGANPDAAEAVGIGRGWPILAAFAATSLAAGIAGVFVVAQFGQGVTGQFPTLNIDCIAAILVGGTSITGGHGSALRTAFGSVFIATLDDFMVLRGYDAGVRTTFVGVAIVGAMCFFSRRQRAGSK
jgi:simple sugar transport system permease protein/ribose transport system permease protein